MMSYFWFLSATETDRSFSVSLKNHNLLGFSISIVYRTEKIDMVTIGTCKKINKSQRIGSLNLYEVYCHVKSILLIEFPPLIITQCEAKFFVLLREWGTQF